MDFSDSTMATNVSSSSVICPWRAEFRKKELALIERWKSSGLFVDSYLDEINCHWFQFEPAQPIFHVLLALLFVAIFLVGTVGNALVVYIMLTSKHLLRTPVNIFVTNLAISDLLMLLKMPVFIYNSMVQGPTLGTPGCKIYGFLGGFTGSASILFLAAISLERCLLIHCYQRGVSSSKPAVLVYYRITVFCIWIFSGAVASLPLFGIGDYVPEGYLTSCSFDYMSEDLTTRLFIFVFFIVAWVVPVSVIIGSYSAVLCFISRNQSLDMSRTVEIIFSGPNAEQQQQQEPLDSLPELDNNHQAMEEQQESTRATGFAVAQSRRDKGMKHEIVIAKITFCLIGLWLVAWTPYAIVALIGISGYKKALTPGVAMLPALFAKLSAAINPYVYSLNSPRIWKEIVRRFRCPSVNNVSSNATREDTAAPARRAGARSNSSRNNRRGAGSARTHRSHNSDVGIPLVEFSTNRVPHSSRDFSSELMARHYPSQPQQPSSYSADFRRPPAARTRLTLNLTRAQRSTNNSTDYNSKH